MYERALTSRNKQRLPKFGIFSSFLLFLLVVVVATWGLTEKWPKPALLFEYHSSIPETRIDVYFKIGPALLFEYRSSIPEAVVAVYFDIGEGMNEEHRHSQTVRSSGEWEEVRLELPSALIHELRLDPALSASTIGLRNLRIVDQMGTVRLQVLPSSIRSGNQILSRSEQNGELEVQTTPDANDPTLLINLEKQIDLRLGKISEAPFDASRMVLRVASLWWFTFIAAFLILDLYYRPIFQHRSPLLYLLIRGDSLQNTQRPPTRHLLIDYVAGTLVLSFLVYAAIFTPYVQQEPHIRSDGISYHVWTHGIKSGDLSFCEYDHLLITVGGLNVRGEWETRCHMVKPPGVALIRLPLMIWFVDPSNKTDISNAEHQISQISAIVALMLIIIIFSKIVRYNKISSASAQLTILTVVFGTGLFHYATYDNSFSHVYSALGTSLLLGLTFLHHGKHDSPRYLFLLLIVSLLFVLVRMTSLFVVVFFWALWIYQGGIKSNIRRILASGFGVSGAVVVPLVYNYYVTSKLVISSYGEYGEFLWNRPMLWSVLFDFDKGLFIYYPIFSIALIAGFICNKTRILTLFYLGLILFFALLYGYWYDWSLGGGCGHRGFVDIAPLSIIILALAFEKLQFHLKVILQVFCVLCAVVTMQLMSGFWQATLPNHPTQEIYWAHLLGQEGTPIYWHTIFIIVSAVILFRAYVLENNK